MQVRSIACIRDKSLMPLYLCPTLCLYGNSFLARKSGEILIGVVTPGDFIATTIQNNQELGNL